MGSFSTIFVFILDLYYKTKPSMRRQQETDEEENEDARVDVDTCEGISFIARLQCVASDCVCVCEPERCTHMPHMHAISSALKKNV